MLPISQLLRRRVMVAAVLTAGLGVVAAVPTVAMLSNAASPQSPSSSAAQAANGSGQPGAQRKGKGDHAHRPAMKTVIADTARISGQSTAQVIAALRSGKTLGEIVGGKQAELKAALLADLKTALDKAVAAHKITAAQEAKMLDKAGPRLDKLMAHTFKNGAGHRDAAGAGAAAQGGAAQQGA